MAEIIGTILVLVGSLAFLGSLVWLIVAAVRKTPKRMAAFLLVGSIVASFTGGAMLPPSDGDDDAGNELVAAAVPKAPKPTPTPTFEEMREIATEIPYDDLMRNIEQHVDSLTVVSGEAIQVTLLEDNPQNPDSKLQLARVDVGGERGTTRDVWLEFLGPVVLEGDSLMAIGKVKGLKNYETVLGGSRTIPQVYSEHVRITGIR